MIISCSFDWWTSTEMRFGWSIMYRNWLSDSRSWWTTSSPQEACYRWVTSSAMSSSSCRIRNGNKLNLTCNGVKRLFNVKWIWAASGTKWHSLQTYSKVQFFFMVAVARKEGDTTIILPLWIWICHLKGTTYCTPCTNDRHRHQHHHHSVSDNIVTLHYKKAPVLISLNCLILCLVDTTFVLLIHSPSKVQINQLP